MGKNKLKIGITGGIGSGKSTVSNLFEEAGYFVIRADDLAKDILISDPEVKKNIIEAFGDEVYKDDSLNKEFLAAKVFSNEENVEKINSIVHPPTIEKILQLITEELEKKDLVFVEAALILESSLDVILDYVLLVTAEDDIRLNRVLEKGNISEDEIRNRMSYQMSEKGKESLSDFIIENNSSIEELKTKAKFFLELFETLAD
ncbi:MAG: dephospho-CoA kinase [Melioribacteraceae bacterium]|nr:dephospho-CoA kinase [Melioribacteraceae bacterium]